MSNPKGLKNIPAIRQNVAMFLRNICFQVITIHLFGFKVYEFEKIKFFFINIFVQVIILRIFVEIIKKSTTMKNIITTLILTVSTLIGYSQLGKYEFYSKLDSTVVYNYTTVVKHIDFINELNIPYVDLADRYSNDVSDKNHKNYFEKTFSELPNENTSLIPYDIFISQYNVNDVEHPFFHLFDGYMKGVTDYKVINVNNDTISKVLIFEYCWFIPESNSGSFSTMVLYLGYDGLWYLPK